MPNLALTSSWSTIADGDRTVVIFEQELPEGQHMRSGLLLSVTWSADQSVQFPFYRYSFIQKQAFLLPYASFMKGQYKKQPYDI